ncbi:MAG: DNA internalization-related competence protein ComEC/Rec2 [Deltaproteobacteria bacterium]|nr:DNA internalization-related competence protein ComEC/Rec2 [Deltaproteobacteria bacterium]
MNHRPIIPVLISFVSGIVIATYYPISEDIIFSLLIAILLFAILLLLKRIGLYPAIYLAFFFLGSLLMFQEINPVLPPNHIKNIIGDKKEKLNIQGKLYRSPERFTDRTRLYVEAERLFKENDPVSINGKILLTVDSPDVNLRYGDRIRFISKTSKPRNFGNPGEYDYKWHFEREGIYAKGFMENERWIVPEGRETHFLWTGLENIRKALNDLIDKTASNNKGIMKALLIGESGEIPKEIRAIFAKTGTSHILAMSGLHIGIVAFVVYSLFYKILIQSEKLTLKFNIRKLAAAASIPPVLFYGLIAGMPVSTQRAVIMVIVFILALIINREKDLFNTLALAAFVILIISPSAVYDISFQLSFASVAAIVYLMPKFKTSGSEPLPHSRYIRLRDKIITGLLVSIAASLGTSLIVAYHFHRVSITGIFANLIAVPLIGFIIVSMELAAGAVSLFSFMLAKFIMQTASIILSFSVWIIELFSRLPYSSIWVSAPTVFEFVLFYFLIISITEIRRAGFVKYAVIVLTIILIGDYGYWYYKVNYNKDLKVTFLSIGQGDSALVEFPKGTRMLVDGGGFRDSDFDTGERLIAPFLWKSKIKTIDYIVMSHPQSDHFKGLKFIAENFNVKEFWWNGDNSLSPEFKELMQTIEKKNIKKRSIDMEVMDINGVKIESLNPIKPEVISDKNNASLVMRLSFGKVGFLFTGDIEKEAEESLLKEGKDIKADVLKVPHHGSQTSSTEGFIRDVSPQIAVISLGYANPFRFPHESVVERYQDMGIKIMRTDTVGAVTVETDGNEKRVSSYW